MKKNEIYVVIDSEEKRQKAMQILSNANEKVFDNSVLKIKFFSTFFLTLDSVSKKWCSLGFLYTNNIEQDKTKITLEELEVILSPNYAIKDIHLTIDELKAQAEMLGFELVKKERKPKVGEFGVFWDDSKYKIHVYDFIHNIENDVFTAKYSAVWKNFRHLTEEEKQEIQMNW
jgi:hypothetical protein